VIEYLPENEARYCSLNKADVLYLEIGLSKLEKRIRR